MVNYYEGEGLSILTQLGRRRCRSLQLLIAMVLFTLGFHCFLPVSILFFYINEKLDCQCIREGKGEKGRRTSLSKLGLDFRLQTRTFPFSVAVFLSHSKAEKVKKGSRIDKYEKKKEKIKFIDVVLSFQHGGTVIPQRLSFPPAFLSSSSPIDLTARVWEVGQMRGLNTFVPSIWVVYLGLRESIKIF